MLNADIVAAADRLKESTIQSCMMEQGFQYQMHPMSIAAASELAVTQRLDNRSVLDGWYGYRDADRAFGVPVAAPDPNQSRVDAMDEQGRTAYLRALTVSTPSGPSCAGQGEAAAADAVVGPATQRLGALFGDLMVRVRTDTRVMSALTAWQQCMQKAGYTYASRDELIVDLKEDAGRINFQGNVNEVDPAVEALQSRASTLARVDVDCDESAGLERVTREVQLAEERKLADSETALLDEVDRERNHLLQSGDSNG